MDVSTIGRVVSRSTFPFGTADRQLFREVDQFTVADIISVMLMLAQIDLSRANLALFEEYEAKVLALLERYGARLEERLRSNDGTAELHLLYFPDAASLAAFRGDPVRASAQSIWEQSGASSTLKEVARLG